jgi:hypothetical protein
MAYGKYTSGSIADKQIGFNGGLNNTAGPLFVQDNQASDLLNVDFDAYGSILKRGGYTALNTSALAASPDIDGLHWFEYDASGTTTRYIMAVAGTKAYKMDALDGTWDDITGAATITAGNHCDFENFLNEVYITNGNDVPLKWTGTGNVSAMTVPTGLTKAKYVRLYNNYLFLANVTVSATAHPSRIYWSNIKNTGTWVTTNFIDIAQNDGQEITGMKVLADRLIVFKTRSIYNVFFTGDADLPFILPGGGKTGSAVGCVAPFSIQQVDNGLVFASFDGVYLFDGNNSQCISTNVSDTFSGMNLIKMMNLRSLNYVTSSMYYLAFPDGAATENDSVLVWDYGNNAWSLYDGIAASAMTTIYVNGTDERPYFGDYAGFVYRMDTGLDDYPLNVQTAINAYYYTNWRTFGDIVNKKGIPHIYLYYAIKNATISLSYSWDFEDSDQYTQLVSTATSTDVYGTGVYGVAVYAGTGGGVGRRDLIGRGRTVRFKFANNTLSETFQIDGLGMYLHLETMA